MLTKIILSAALTLGTASAALAAHKGPVRHPEQRAAPTRAVPPGYYSYGYSQPPRGEETYIGVQDRFYRESNGD